MQTSFSETLETLAEQIAQFNRALQRGALPCANEAAEHASNAAETADAALQGRLTEGERAAIQAIRNHIAPRLRRILEAQRLFREARAPEPGIAIRVQPERAAALLKALQAHPDPEQDDVLDLIQALKQELRERRKA